MEKQIHARCIRSGLQRQQDDFDWGVAEAKVMSSTVGKKWLQLCTVCIIGCMVALHQIPQSICKIKA